MVLGPFPERKGPRLPGRNPATQIIAWKLSFDKRVRGYPTINEMLGIHKTQDGFPINNVGNDWMGK